MMISWLPSPGGQIDLSFQTTHCKCGVNAEYFYYFCQGFLTVLLDSQVCFFFIGPPLNGKGKVPQIPAVENVGNVNFARWYVRINREWHA